MPPLYLNFTINTQEEYDAWVAMKKEQNPGITDEQLKNDANAAGITLRDYDYVTYTKVDGFSGKTLEELDISGFENYTYEGFHYGTTTMTTETVKGDGTTVINVYYDRNIHTLRFYASGRDYTYTATTSDDGTQYGFINGQPVQLTREIVSQDKVWYFQYVYSAANRGSYRLYNATHTYVNQNIAGAARYNRSNGSLANNAYSGTRYVRTGIGYQYYSYTATDSDDGQLYGLDGNGGYVELNSATRPSNKWTYVDSNGVTRSYTGTRYTRSTTQSSGNNNLIYSITALYEQNIADIFPIVGSNGTTYDNGERWNPVNSSTYRQVLVFLDIMPDEDVRFEVNTSTNGLKVLTYYVEALPGEHVDVTRNGVNYKTYHVTNARYGYFTEAEDFFDIIGFTKKESNPAFVNGEVRNSNTIDLYYTRNSYTLTLDTNYPLDQVIYFDDNQWDQTYNSVVRENEKHQLLYEAPLNEYGSTGSSYWEPKAPDHYYFDGWYEDATCTVPFNFDSTMPAANKVVYAKWTPETFRIHINPNGAEIDHINHNGNPTFRSDLDYYYADKATYINADYGTSISEYTLTRDYVPISDAVAQTMDEDDVYYYIYSKYYEDTGRGLPADLRNALYVKESELDSYYQYYVDLITSLKATNPERYNEVTILGPAAWRNAYVSTQKYRKKYQNEHYEFLGWFKDDDTMPYNFSDPVEESFTLTAHWRLDGGYSVMYIPEYITPNGTHINGNIEIWQDPQSGATYADQAATTILQQPTSLTANGTPVDDDAYIFRGWQLVSIGGTVENPIYTPLENGVYYQEGDEFVIEAKNANAEGIIYLQAVYEEKETSYRRPEIANLTLDANSGFITEDGETELDSNKNLEKIGDVGTVAVDAENDQIIFGDLQSNIAVHVDDYAINPNYFKHPNGYYLLGFDDEPDERDYIASYAADSIISVQRTDEETVYAVWEPMVYLNFVNDTEVGDVTIRLSASDSSALYVVNIATGTYERVAVTDLGNITVKKGESIRLAIPYGAEKEITISGTNELGPGQVLLWDSKVSIDNTTYDTYDNITTEYGHAIDDDFHSHQLAKGQKDNNEEFFFNETLIVDDEGLTVTFRAVQHDRTLVLHDNYRENTQEIYFANPLTTDGFDLPTPSTRIGYEFVGWDTERLPDNTDQIPDYPVGTDISNVSEFFGEDQIETLYAVWKAKAETGEMYVYKLVPEPGDQDKEFDFAISLTGSYRLDSNNSVVPISSANNTSGNSLTQSFRLSHGQYLLIKASKYVGATGVNGRPWIQAVVQKYDQHDPDNPLETKTVRWQRNDNVRGTVTFDNYAYINVSENNYSSEFYDTDIDIAAETQNGSLAVMQDERMISWTAIDAGGTVFYNNIRQAADVIVRKNLTGNTLVGTFGYSASYTLDNKTTDLGTFNVTSNSETGYILEGIPVGAVLTISETEDSSYNVSTSFENGSTDSAPADNTVSFTVPNGGEVITYTNALKSYPVRILKVDQDGNVGVEARFDLSQDGANIVSGKYTTPTNNIVYEGSLYVGTYTLTETWTQTGYLGLGEPVGLTLSGDGTLESDNSSADVSGNANDGFVVTVTNQATKDVTVQKILNDPLISQRTFSFAAVYELDGITQTLPSFSILSSRDAAGSYILTVPVGADLTVTEDTAGFTGIYDTVVSMNGEEGTDASTITLENVREPEQIVFTNTRKTADITVAKEMSDPTDSTSFTFTAALKNGSTPLPDYLVFTTPDCYLVL